MGLTCATLHVFSPELSLEGSAPRVGQLAEAAADSLGYERTDNSEEAERIFVAAGAPPWVSFLDMTNPDVVTGESADLGKALSAASRCPTLLTSVLDSDAFAFLLFEGGKQIDGHASTRGMLPGRIKKWAPERRAKEWSRLFGRSIGIDDVCALTQKEVLFADDLLLSLCDLIGLSRELATSTARDLERQPWPNQKQLYFRSRPGALGGRPVTQTVAYRPETLRCPIALDADHWLPFELNGPAEAFSNPVLEFSGPAVDARIVALLEGHGLWAMGMKAIRAGEIRKVNAVISTDEAEGRRVLRACLQGLSAEPFGFPPRKQSILSCWAVLRGVAPGAGELRVSCLPNASAAERLSLRPVFLVEVSAASGDSRTNG